MAKKTKVILTAVIIGMIVAFCLATPIVSIYWFNVNPALSEIQDSVTDRMTLTEAESAQMSQMMAAGAVIDFMVNLALYTCPAVSVGGVIGLISGIFWYRRGYKNRLS